MQIIINLEAFAVTSRGQSVTVDPALLSPDIWARLAMHGAGQKIADAASGAGGMAVDEGLDIKSPEGKARAAELALPMMQKAHDALVAGEWSARNGDGGVSEEVKVQRMVMRTLVKAKYGAKSPEWAKFTGLADDEQNGELDKWFAKNAEALENEVAGELKRRDDARKAKAKLLGAAKIEL